MQVTHPVLTPGQERGEERGGGVLKWKRKIKTKEEEQQGETPQPRQEMEKTIGKIGTQLAERLLFQERTRTC